MMEDQVHWTGVGRWLSFVTAGLLIIVSVPAVFDHEFGAVAGWNIFFGVLLIGVIAAGHPKAPLLAAILCALMTLRLIISLALGSIVEGGVNLLLGTFLLAVWLNLKKQSAAS